MSVTTNTKNKGGRPAKSEAAKRKHSLKLGFSVDEYAQFSKRAAAFGLGTSPPLLAKFARKCILDEPLVSVPLPNRELAVAMNRLGANFNQALRRGYVSPDEAKKVADLLNYIARKNYGMDDKK